MRMIKLFMTALLFLLISGTSLAAIGCDLNEPDRDVHRFFPDSTGYKTEYYSIQKLGGEKLLKKIEARLGDKFHGLYETIDVPYAVYTVLNGKKVIGYIHGVNQKGEFGGIQIFFTFDAKGTVRDQYFQKMTAPYAGKFRDKSFAVQFRGLKLKDFSGDGNKRITNPVPIAANDFKAIMRGAKKNLILMDEFIFSKGGI